MFSSPFPENIGFSCQSTRYANEFPKHAEEQILLNTVISESRRIQFLAGRSCARKALLYLGIEEKPVLRNLKTREPLWPHGFCGSITHSGKWAAAAAANQSEVSGIGIDLEYLKRKVDPNFCKSICVKEELKWLESLKKELAEKAVKLIFSAKESIFKAYFPATRIYLHFHDAKVILGNNLDYFEYQLLIKKSDFSKKVTDGQGKIQTINDVALTSIFIKSNNINILNKESIFFEKM